mgnify:CR=1 FL=1
MEPPTTKTKPERPLVVPSTSFSAERARLALRSRHHWEQLVKFGMVGASGFVVNFAVYTLCLRVLGIHYLPAAVVAFAFAVGNNFLWNRVWTFRHDRGDRHVAHQGLRFLTVATAALVPNLVLLRIFVEGVGLGKITAQVIAVVLVTPISFLGNKLWSFR